MRLGLVVPAAIACGLLAACGAYVPASIEYVDHSPSQPKLGQATTVEFRAVDNTGQPQPGATIHFRLLNPLPGVTLAPEYGTTDKSSGVASTQIVANARVASVVVVAEAGNRMAQSPPISFAGAVPNARWFTFQCGELAGAGSGGIHAIGAWDQTRSLIAGVKLTCTAHVGDRNSDGVPDAVVSFMTEAGTITPSTTSVSDVVGNATILYKTSYPLPQDVAPGTFSWSPSNDLTHTGQYIAPLWMHPFDWKSNPVLNYAQPPDLNEPRRADPIRPGITNNPRDNLVTMIAITSGEEAFTDLNDNGQYDPGEPYEDTTEPFVDANDNGTWDPGELYVDTNGNGHWDGKNNQYDSNTLIWTQERILWTGIPDDHDFQDVVEPIFKQISPPPVVPHFGNASVTLLLSDPWFNTMAQNGGSDGCQILTNGNGPQPPVTSQTSTFGDVGIRFTYPSYELATVTLVDAHDPTRTNPPDYPWNDCTDRGTNDCFPSGLPFTAGISCSFTASPNAGEAIGVAVPSISGVVY